MNVAAHLALTAARRMPWHCLDNDHFLVLLWLLRMLQRNQFRPTDLQDMTWKGGERQKEEALVAAETERLVGVRGEGEQV